ncbi:MAG: hypothetical protein NVS3B24_11090 [Candidatus Dormibacteria bacterium]
MLSLLRAQGLTICAAESCTGGLLCAALTEVPGSSEFFLGGVVTYANDAKVNRLGVKESTLRAQGAVSAEVAAEMVVGVREMFSAAVALSVTGIAGPGSEGEKPSGLTFIGCAFDGRVEVRQYNWTGGRASNRVASVEAALRLATDVLS